MFVSLVSRDYCVALPHDATGLFAVCDCGISRSYSLTIFNLKHTYPDFLTSKIVKQLNEYHKIRKVFFSKFYHRHSELIFKYKIGLKLFCNKAYQNRYLMVI